MLKRSCDWVKPARTWRVIQHLLLLLVLKRLLTRLIPVWKVPVIGMHRASRRRTGLFSRVPIPPQNQRRNQTEQQAHDLIQTVVDRCHFLFSRHRSDSHKRFIPEQRCSVSRCHDPAFQSAQQTANSSPSRSFMRPTDNCFSFFLSI